MTDDEVAVGVYYIDAQEVSAYIESSGINAGLGDTLGQYEAMADWIDANGGVAGGRGLTLVPYEYQYARGADENYAAMCAAWTQDAQVYAGFAGILGGSGPVGCLADADTLSIDAQYEVGSEDHFAQYAPYYHAPGSLETISGARTYVQGLASHGYFAQGGSALDESPRIGLMYFDWPEYRTAIERGLEPALAAAGLQVDESFGVSAGGHVSELGSIGAQVANAELQFAAAGITHVLFLDIGATLAMFYMQRAQQQGRTYEYGLSTMSNPAFLEQQSGIDAQLPHAVAIGWNPGADTNHLESAPPNAARDQCLEIMKAAGHEPVSPSDLAAMLGICSRVFFLREVLDRATSYDPAAFAEAAAALGPTGVTAAYSHGDHFTPDRPWGAAAYGVLPFDPGCACFIYQGPARHIEFG